MISKKQLEKRIADLEAQVRQLENMHARVIPANSWQSMRYKERGPFDNYVYDGVEASYCGRQLTAAELKYRYEHPLTKEHTAHTNKVSGVTHEELARFILDGKPIVREETFPSVKLSIAPAVPFKVVPTTVYRNS